MNTGLLRTLIRTTANLFDKALKQESASNSEDPNELMKFKRQTNDSTIDDAKLKEAEIDCSLFTEKRSSRVTKTKTKKKKNIHEEPRMEQWVCITSRTLALRRPKTHDRKAKLRVKTANSTQNCYSTASKYRYPENKFCDRRERNK